MANKKTIKATASFLRGTGQPSVGVGANQALHSNPNVVVDTTSIQVGKSSVTPQTGGTGDANINPYHNAYEAYQTSMNKAKNAQIGQLNTQYNQQQEQINGQYNNMGRNAYVTYMQREQQNRNAASNMGANRTGMAENMQTANLADYNRSIGNAGAYRQTQLSNAENAYNSATANVENQYDTDLANKQLEYDNMGIQRQNELADMQTQLDFQAQQNALDRQQQAKEADRTYNKQVQAYNDAQYERKFNQWSDTIAQYNTVDKCNKAIKKLQNKKKAGNLKGWQKEYYTVMMNYLKAQRTVARQNKK